MGLLSLIIFNSLTRGSIHGIDTSDTVVKHFIIKLTTDRRIHEGFYGTIAALQTSALTVLNQAKNEDGNSERPEQRHLQYQLEVYNDSHIDPMVYQ